MPPGASSSVPGRLPIMPETYSVWPTRTADENGRSRVSRPGPAMYSTTGALACAAPAEACAPGVGWQPAVSTAMHTIGSRIAVIDDPPCLDWSDFVRARGAYDVIGGAERERHDGLGRLAAARGHEARPVADEQVGHVVTAMPAVGHRGFRVVAHAARAEQVRADRLRRDRCGPCALRTGGVQQGHRVLLQEARRREVVVVIPVGDANGRASPRVLVRRVERDVVAVQR